MRPARHEQAGEGEAAALAVEGIVARCLSLCWLMNAKALMEYSFLGFPLGYYFPVQGSLIVFVALIFFQNHQQDKIDDEAGV